MFMSKDKSEQRGTLLIEAIAMLGLIAMVTPTLYKKSAERLQEIQDINIASQARMMNGIIETFVNNHKGEFLSSNGSSQVFELFPNNSTSSSGGIKPYAVGYSSVIPAGFKPNDIKYFGSPRVFVVSDAAAHSIVYYIVYPKSSDIGARRTAKLASLVGSNGGFVREAGAVQGVGSSWVIDGSVINNYGLDKITGLFTENTLVMTNTETISTKETDNDKYLWRERPNAGEEYHNTMITDLYLGGNTGDPSDDHTTAQTEFYSIFNVRKLTLNTRCNAQNINNAATANEECQALNSQVADLYIGKPVGRFLQDPTIGDSTSTMKAYQPNTGAAWIYGNLSALSDRFKLFNTDYDSSATRKGYDVMEFSREEVVDAAEPTNNISGMEVLQATNEKDKAQVRFMNGHVRVVEKGMYGSTNTYNTEAGFYVGGDADSTRAEGRQIAAFRVNSNKDIVMINDIADRNTETYINRQGGVVHINGSSSETEADAGSTYVNEGGGYLIAGKDGRWMRAEGTGSAKVMMLYDSSGSVPANASFSVAGSSVVSSAVWANSQMVSLQDGAIRAYKKTQNFKDTNKGGSAAIAEYESGLDNEAKLGSTLTGGAVLAAKYTDILGSTYVGTDEMHAILDDSLPFKRGDWQLGVAGSAWVDEMLFANEAWFNSSGFKELHAGFSSYADFQKNSRKGWLNAYKDGVSISYGDGSKTKEQEKAEGKLGSILGTEMSKARFMADSTQVYLGDSMGGMAIVHGGTAQLGYANSSAMMYPINYVGADSSGARAVGSQMVEVYTTSSGVNLTDATRAVDIQKGALLLRGHSWADDAKTGHTYGKDHNVIEAHASDFEVYTKDATASTASSKAQFRVDDNSAVVQHIDFAVRDASSTVGKARFLVRPDEDRWPSDDKDKAHVMVDGSFYVTGNKVMHVASNSSNVADNNSHAMFEIDPTAIKVMAMNGSSSIDSSMILKINPMDISGSSDTGGVLGDADGKTSIYIRKGAIELMHNTEGSSWAADAGFGYIKADRLVVDSSNITAPYWGGNDSTEPKYDQYMVNPAYTSVMHDIKLTTRGGARLSDILPDYILKGVYIVANDFLEGKKERIRWSAGDYYCDRADKGDLLGGATCTKNTVKVAWADPYVGVVPFAPCPPGYKNMATITPTSFQMAQAGDIMKSEATNKDLGASIGGKYVVNPKPKYTDILRMAAGSEIIMPTYGEIKTVIERNTVNSSGGDVKFESSHIAGWFLGFNAEYEDDGTENGHIVSTMDSSNSYALKFKQNNTKENYVAMPLYFQQNTFLKTALGEIYRKDGVNKGWNAYMGFLYDENDYGMGKGLGEFKEQRNTDSTVTSGWQDLHYVWNLFPIPTNSIDGYAHVYCYFDRTEFLGNNLQGAGDYSKWKDVIDPIDQLSETWQKDRVEKNKNSNPEYQKRLNDPTLKYKDPW